MVSRSVFRISSARASAAALAGLLLTGFAAAPAAAATGDPMPGWAPRPEEAHREVSVNDSGRVYVDASSEPGYKPVDYLEHGYADDWVRTADDGGYRTELATGPYEYAVSVRFGGDRPASYRVHDGTAWRDPAVFYDGPVHDATLDSNYDGDIAVLLRIHLGGTVLARLPRGEEWTVQEVPGVPADVPADVVLSGQGKTTVTWARPDGGTSTVLRSVVHEMSTTLSPPQTVGTVNNPRPNLSIVSDGGGTETIIGGNRLWRQPHSTRPHEYRMRTSVHALLDSGRSTARVVWPAVTEEGYAIRSVIFDEGDRRPVTTLWTHPGRGPQCDSTDRLDGVALGLGMALGGRSYVAVGIERGIESDGRCPDIAALLPVDRFDRVLNEQPLGYFAVGDEFQVRVGPVGPIAVEFKNWDDHADPISEDQPDGLYSLNFYRR